MVIVYITIQSGGNTTTFGNLSAASGLNGSSSWGSQTRGLFGCIGSNGPANNVNTIDYITMASTGDASNFGDLTVARGYSAGGSDLTRGLTGGAWGPSNSDVIDYITILI